MQPEGRSIVQVLIISEDLTLPAPAPPCSIMDACPRKNISQENYTEKLNKQTIVGEAGLEMHDRALSRPNWAAEGATELYLTKESKVADEEL